MSGEDEFGGEEEFGADDEEEFGADEDDEESSNDEESSDDGAYRDWETDRKSTRLNSSHITRSRMPSSA